MVKPEARVGTVEVTADGEGLVSHAGVALLVELSDRVGLTGALSGVLAGTRERRSAHDPGRVLRDVARSTSALVIVPSEADTQRFAVAMTAGAWTSTPAVLSIVRVSSP